MRRFRLFAAPTLVALLVWATASPAALGQREVAVLLLRDAYAQGYPMNEDYDVMPHADRDFAELLHDPAFVGVIRRE